MSILQATVLVAETHDVILQMRVVSVEAFQSVDCIVEAIESPARGIGVRVDDSGRQTRRNLFGTIAWLVGS